jgi:hypothetical protein
MALFSGHINFIVCHSGFMDQDRRVEARVGEVGRWLGVAGESKGKLKLKFENLIIGEQKR